MRVFQRNEFDPPLPLEREQEAQRARLLGGIVLLLITVLFHLVVLLTVKRIIPWMEFPKSPVAPSVEIQKLDSKTLEKMKEKWRAKTFLPSDEPLEPEDHYKKIDPPSSARYFSDRNRVVEKEQRAHANKSTRKGRSKPPSESPSTKKSLAHLGLAWNLKGDQRRSDLDQVHKARDENQNDSERISKRSGASSSQKLSLPEEEANLIADRNLPFGGETLLNSEKSIYYSFYSRLYDAIVPLWQSKAQRQLAKLQFLLPNDYVTRVKIILSGDGLVKKIILTQTAGITELDDTVYETFREINNIPHPPSDLVNDHGEVIVPFSFLISINNENRRWTPNVRMIPPQPGRLTQ